MKRAKEKYENIEIPEELSQVVNQAIEDSAKKRAQMKRRGQRMAACRWGMGVAASFVLAFTAGLNTSEAFAMQAQQLPVIGGVAKVLTVRNYHFEDDVVLIQGEVPEIQVEDAQGTEVAEKINQEIQKVCDAYVAEAEGRAEEYKQAFLDTGGTEEEWNTHKFEITVDYEIKSQTADYLSFGVQGTESWASTNSTNQYYNLDLGTWEYVTLEDLLGSDYVDIANAQIREQMKDCMKEDSSQVFWTAEEGGFVSVDENTGFYINEKGNPVVVFDKYEVAPGFMGRPEFEIVK